MRKNTETKLADIFPWESFWLGGFSILVWCAFWMFRGREGSLISLSYFAFGASFVANHPHFLSSYMMLYGDFRSQILRRTRYFWAAVIVPVALLGFLGTALVLKHASWLGYVASLMFFLVGWHYAKQVFGCIIVSSARRKIFYGKWERRSVLANLFTLWSISWLNTETLDRTYQFYGIAYQSRNLPSWLLTVAYGFVIATGVLAIFLQGRKYVLEGTKPAMPAVIALLSLYCWNIPLWSHPSFAYFIPFFHSAQYLMLVQLYKRNQVRSSVVALPPVQARAAWLRRYFGYFAGAAILGAIFFEFLPRGLDSNFSLASDTLGQRPWLACSLLFINIHHYFIDNVIWRSDNAEMKRHLFGVPVASEAAPETRTGTEVPAQAA